IGDVFVVNKADLDGADRTVQQLREMLQGRSGRPDSGHHGATELAGDHGDGSADDSDDGGDDVEPEAWNPPIVETVANRGEGVEDFLGALADHGEYLDRTGRREGQERERFAAEIRTLLREDANELLAGELDRRGGIERYVDAVIERHTDPYTVVDEVLEPLRECLHESRD
ncbi:MAG: methylmalonyl Co-A mutase-associated GTPase MeaB, partial [Haloarcula sp.]